MFELRGPVRAGGAETPHGRLVSRARVTRLRSKSQRVPGGGFSRRRRRRRRRGARVRRSESAPRAERAAVRGASRARGRGPPGAESESEGSVRVGRGLRRGARLGESSLRRFQRARRVLRLSLRLLQLSRVRVHVDDGASSNRARVGEESKRRGGHRPVRVRGRYRRDDPRLRVTAEVFAERVGERGGGGRRGGRRRRGDASRGFESTSRARRRCGGRDDVDERAKGTIVVDAFGAGEVDEVHSAHQRRRGRRRGGGGVVGSRRGETREGDARDGVRARGEGGVSSRGGAGEDVSELGEGGDGDGGGAVDVDGGASLEKVAASLAMDLDRGHLHAGLRAVVRLALRLDAREERLGEARGDASSAALRGAHQRVGLAGARLAEGDHADVVSRPRGVERGLAHVAIQALLRRGGADVAVHALRAVAVVQGELLGGPRVDVGDAQAMAGRALGHGEGRARPGVELGVGEGPDAHRHPHARQSPIPGTRRGRRHVAPPHPASVHAARSERRQRRRGREPSMGRG